MQDMTTDGGGWTLVFHENQNVRSWQLATNNPNRQTLGGMSNNPILPTGTQGSAKSADREINALKTDNGGAQRSAPRARTFAPLHAPHLHFFVRGPHSVVQMALRVRCVCTACACAPNSFGVNRACIDISLTIPLAKPELHRGGRYRVTSHDITNRYYFPGQCNYRHYGQSSYYCERYSSTYSASSGSYIQCELWHPKASPAACTSLQCALLSRT